MKAVTILGSEGAVPRPSNTTVTPDTAFVAAADNVIVVPEMLDIIVEADTLLNVRVSLVAIMAVVAVSIVTVLEDIPDKIKYPPWLGTDMFHSSHRANLLRKDLEYYSNQGWVEDSDNPYAWYDTDKHQWYLQHVGTGIREYI